MTESLNDTTQGASIHSQPRVDLVRYMGASPIGPSAARICNGARELEALDIGWSLENIDVQACADVPSNTIANQRLLVRAPREKHTGNAVAIQLGYPVSTAER
jgi:hypothetical protein